ncbi:MAG: metallopeptidase family protein [Actinomycetes bacterium]
MRDDRHARHRRAGADPRRRPTDGFRATNGDRFDRLVADAISDLPQAFLDRLDNVAIVVADVPPADVLGRGDEILLGLYEGTPQPARSLGAPLLPDRITLFRRPLELRATTKADLALLVQETVVHEVAHHFGLDDDELDELGWG